MPLPEITNLAARRGLFFPSAEIYSDALAGFYEYGPEGARIKHRIVQLWRRLLVEKEHLLEIDGSIILPENVFRASGHLENFNDPLVVCESCKTPYRPDKLLEEKFLNISKNPTKGDMEKIFPKGANIPEAAPNEYFDGLIEKFEIKCPKCGSKFGKTIRFNMMMKVDVGATKTNPAYLRSEACQSIFLDFIRIWKQGRVKLPLGIAQVGKAFRNEIAPRQGLLRKRELEQMDVEIFFNPEKINEVENWDDVKDYPLNLFLLAEKEISAITCQEAVEQNLVSGKIIAYYLARTQQFGVALQIPLEKMCFRELEKEARAFYSHETWDFEVEVDGAWVELAACNYRTDYDLKSHAQQSKNDLQVREEGDISKFTPHIFEISMGVDRTFIAALDVAFRKEVRGTEERIFLDLPHRIAPYKVGIYPLMKKDGLSEEAYAIFLVLQRMSVNVCYDESGSIGKRYARADEIGIPYGITVDYDTLKNQTVTLRERNSMNQKRVPVEALDEIFWKFSTGRKTFEDLAE